MRDRRALSVPERKRRRRYRLEEKQAILQAAAEVECDGVGGVTAQYGIGRSLIRNWRRQQAVSVLGATVRFTAVAVAPEKPTAAVGRSRSSWTAAYGCGSMQQSTRAALKPGSCGHLDDDWLAIGEPGVAGGRRDGHAAGLRRTGAAGAGDALKRDPHCGHLFVFRGKRGGLIKVLWHDGQGMYLFAKRLERGRFCMATDRRPRR